MAKWVDASVSDPDQVDSLVPDLIPASSFNSKPRTFEYVVMPGDTLASVTKKVFGHNNRDNRYRITRLGEDIVPGIVLHIMF